MFPQSHPAIIPTSFPDDPALIRHRAHTGVACCYSQTLRTNSLARYIDAWIEYLKNNLFKYSREGGFAEVPKMCPRASVKRVCRQKHQTIRSVQESHGQNRAPLLMRKREQTSMCFNRPNQSRIHPGNQAGQQESPESYWTLPGTHFDRFGDHS